jgi:peptidoglycan/xylan/chitin deacetylase (PgdA/CDA1 family)
MRLPPWLIVALIIPLQSRQQSPVAITRGDTAQKKIALVFTGDEFADGGEFIATALNKARVEASFFLTGNFYRNAAFKPIIQTLINDGHYLGSHSDKHLLYCDWTKRDSLLVTRQEFFDDLHHSYDELIKFNVTKQQAHYFLPPYEWYNDSITKWTSDDGLQLINYTPGTRSTADYTYPEMGDRYVSSDAVFQSITKFEKTSASGLNGFILLVHIGTDPRRTDKFYSRLPQLIQYLKKKKYSFVRVDNLLK